MASSDEYEYGSAFTVTTTQAKLPVPAVDKIFSNKLFSVVLLNTGGADIYVYPINASGGQHIQIVVPAGGGELAEQYGWATIAGGFEAVAVGASSTLSIQMYSRDGPEKATPPVVPIAIISTPYTKQEKFLQVKTFLVD
jgi:hypothetical protein